MRGAQPVARMQQVTLCSLCVARWQTREGIGNIVADRAGSIKQEQQIMQRAQGMNQKAKEPAGRGCG